MSYVWCILGNDARALEAFTIDATSGVIRTRVVLDHENRALWRVRVRAQDGGSPPLYTIAELTIEVLDLNDNRPTFSASATIFQVKTEKSEAKFWI